MRVCVRCAVLYYQTCWGPLRTARRSLEQQFAVEDLPQLMRVSTQPVGAEQLFTLLRDCVVLPPPHGRNVVPDLRIGLRCVPRARHGAVRLQHAWHGALRLPSTSACS